MRIKKILAASLLSVCFVGSVFSSNNVDGLPFPPASAAQTRQPRTVVVVPGDVVDGAAAAATTDQPARARAPAAASAVDIRTAMALRLRSYFPGEDLEEDDPRVEAVMELGAYLSNQKSTNKLFEKMDKKLSEMEEAGDNSSSQHATLLANYKWIQGLRAANANQPVPFEDQWATAVSGSDLITYVQLLDQLSPERVDLSQVRLGGGRPDASQSDTRDDAGSVASSLDLANRDLNDPEHVADLTSRLQNPETRARLQAKDSAFSRLDMENGDHVAFAVAHVVSAATYGTDVYAPTTQPTADAPQVVVSDKGGDKPHVSVNTGQSAEGSAFTEETF